MPFALDLWNQLSWLRYDQGSYGTFKAGFRWSFFGPSRNLSAGVLSGGRYFFMAEGRHKNPGQFPLLDAYGVDFAGSMAGSWGAVLERSGPGFCGAAGDFSSGVPFFENGIIFMIALLRG